jgi:hypothetical protein
MENYFDNGISKRTRKKWSLILGGGLFLWAGAVLGSVFLASKRVQDLPHNAATDIMLGSLALLHIQKQPSGSGYLLIFQPAMGMLLALVLSYIVVTLAVQLTFRMHDKKKTPPTA